MRSKKNKSKSVFFDKYLLNLVFSRTIPPIDFKFRLISLHNHSEGPESQISHLGPSLYFMPKIGKRVNFENNIFKLT